MNIWNLSICIAAVAALVLAQSNEGQNALLVPSFKNGGYSHSSVNETQSSSISFVRRAPGPASDEQWDKAVCKGGALLAQMEATDQEAGKMYNPPLESAKSKFEKFPAELEKWGYGFMDYDEYYDFKLSLPLKAALEGLGVNADKKGDGGKNQCNVWEHEEEKTIDNVKYPPTMARYDTVFNPDDGVIIAWGKFSPAYMGAKQNPPVTVLPALKSWSDITFLQWSDLVSKAQKSVGDIRYIFSSPVENDASQALIARAMKNKGKELEAWPGTTFTAESDEGKALLAAPNGVGITYFLSQHKPQMGLKKVSKVAVFVDGGKPPRPPSLLFYIVDA